MKLNPQPKQPRVSLLVADVDGTLVTKEKVLTERARSAVRQLHDAGIAFTITSGRPPLGMKMIVDALDLMVPIAAFNGAIFLRPDYSIIEQNLLPVTVAKRVIEIIDSGRVEEKYYYFSPPIRSRACDFQRTRLLNVYLLVTTGLLTS